MKNILKSFIAAACITTIFGVIGYVDLYPKLGTEVALYNHTPVEGEAILEPGASITQSLYAYTEFDNISIILTQNSKVDELQVLVCDSENNVLNELHAEEYSVERINETDVLVKFSVNEQAESKKSGEYHITFKNQGGGRTISSLVPIRRI